MRPFATVVEDGNVLLQQPGMSGRASKSRGLLGGIASDDLALGAALVVLKSG